jgi:glyoxylase-like metal-dependent hydrolase (beta-lactamase superfamily II)
MLRQKLTRLADNVWLWPHSSSVMAIQSSVGIITGENETVLVDAGNSPELARRIKDELRQAGLPPVGQIIYTHHHWDHVYGACEFQVPVISHSLCKTILAEEAQKPWGPEYLRQVVAHNPRLRASYRARARAVQNWATFCLIVPDIVFDDFMTIQLGQIRLELEHVGGQHAADSIVVKVPHARLMFLGDCYYPPPLHLRTPDSKPALAMLAALESKEYTLYVEGHDKPLTRAKLLGVLAKQS